MRIRRGTEEGKLDLVPIMNLVSILIPFLLIAANFVHLAVVEVTAPSIGDGEAPEPPEHSLSIVLSAEGLSVLGAGEVLDEDPYLIPCEGPCFTNGYDTEELTRTLGLLKDEWPDHESLVLVPDGSVPYERLINVMDASRFQGGRPLFPYQSVAGGQ